MSALTEALSAVQHGTGCPRCLVGRLDVMADPMFNCDVCHGTGVPHFQMLSAVEDLLAALKALRAAAENSVYNNSPTADILRAYEQADIAARAAIAKAEGRQL